MEIKEPLDIDYDNIPVADLVELQSMEIKEPLDIDYDNIPVADLVEKLEYAIEQHPSFLKVIPATEIKKEEDLNSEREWSY